MSDRKNEGFHRKESGSRKSLAKEREEYFEPGAMILPCRLPPLPGGGRSRTSYLVSVDQEITNCLIKITLLVKVISTVWFGIKSKVGVMGFSTSPSDTTLSLWFSS